MNNRTDPLSTCRPLLSIRGFLLCLMAIVMLGTLGACSGSGDTEDTPPDTGGNSGGGSDPQPIPSNPDFLTRAKAATFHQIKLYDGHIDSSLDRPTELDTTNLDSGQLVTIEVFFEATSAVSDYALSAYLLPQSLFAQIGAGSTLAEVVDISSGVAGLPDLTELQGVFVESIESGDMQALIHAKLPVLETDETFKVVITPSIDFLAGDQPVNETDAGFTPVLVDSRELNIHKLEQVAMKLKRTPKLIDSNDFTELEANANVGINGFTQDPVFQTFIELDVTTFNLTENVILKMEYIEPAGTTHPLGLLGDDELGNSTVDLQAQFQVDRSETSAARLPVVAYAPLATQKILLKRATPIGDIADQSVEDAHFQLSLFYLDNGVEVSAGAPIDFFLPLVSQPSRLKMQTGEQALGFTVLRAGSGDTECLRVSTDIDTGKIIADSSSIIGVTNCIDTPNDSMLWRYDTNTRQYISKIKDLDDNNYCITVNVDSVVSGGGGTIPKEARLEKCVLFGPFDPIPFNTTQQLEFEGNKLKSKHGFLKVDQGIFFKELMVEDNFALADDFFRDANGVELDNDGRLFYVGKFHQQDWGSDDLAKVSLSYGAEAFVDYMPALGATEQGHLNFNFALFDIAKADIIDVNFALKRYFNKKISTSGANSPNIVVGNGASFTFEFFGIRVIGEGEIVNTTLTQTFDPADDLGNVVMPDITLNPSDPFFAQEVSEEFFNQIFMVWVIPVRISGGLEGSLDINYELTTPGLSASAKVVQDLKLSAFLKADVAIAGITGTIEAINQKLTFDANAGFTMDNSEPKFTLGVGSSLLAELNLLKGKVDAFVKYYSLWSFKEKTKKVNLYDSGYLFDDKWTIYDENPVDVTLEW